MLSETLDCNDDDSRGSSSMRTCSTLSSSSSSSSLPEQDSFMVASGGTLSYISSSSNQQYAGGVLSSPASSSSSSSISLRQRQGLSLPTLVAVPVRASKRTRRERRSVKTTSLSWVPKGLVVASAVNMAFLLMTCLFISKKHNKTAMHLRPNFMTGRRLSGIVDNESKEGNAFASAAAGAAYPLMKIARADEVNNTTAFSRIQQLKQSFEHHQDIVVFYNIYVPPSDIEAAEHSLEIVQEQLHQIGTSAVAAASFTSNHNLQVYYTTIGNPIHPEWIQSICSQHNAMTCTHLGHYNEAFEEVTLTHLHDYCNIESDSAVIYLHNKGSFHRQQQQQSSPVNKEDYDKLQDPENDPQTHWRRSSTAAATSQECMTALLLDDNNDDSEQQQQQCNACGLLFQPLPEAHYPGNMWSAKCSYIQNLLSPAMFHERKSQVDEWVQQQQDNGLYFSELFLMESHFTGTKRYEAEHWMGSHPSIRPCDVSLTANIHDWTIKPVSDKEVEDVGTTTTKKYNYDFELSPAPRHDINNPNWAWHQYTKHQHQEKVSNVVTNIDDTLELFRENPALYNLDYFFLRGVIARWNIYYGDNNASNSGSSSSSSYLPASDSWVWSWYPNGQLWKDGVAHYGLANVADALVQPHEKFYRHIVQDVEHALEFKAKEERDAAAARHKESRASVFKHALRRYLEESVANMESMVETLLH